MDDEHTKGGVSDVKGTIKEGIGRVTGDEDTQAEGQGQQAQGDAQRGLGDVQDTLRGNDGGDRSSR